MIMAVPFPDPFGTLLEFQQAVDALRTSGWLDQSVSGGGAFPPLNVFRKGEDIVIISELPGIRKADLQIQVKDRTIRLAGIKTVEYGERAGVHRRERAAGSFDRAVSLPIEIDAAGVKAEYRDGILALYLPRAERDKPKTITVA
jgi:HSP20 family protein